MPGLFDLLQSAMGHPDPSAQLAQALGQGAGQAGNPNGPQPTAPPGPGSAPGGPAGPGNAAPAPPQPQAYQSPPDLSGMYMQLAQRQQQTEQFNRGLGLLAASAYPGRHPEMIMNAMTNQTQDPGALIGNVMKLQQYQQSQQRLAGLQNAIPGLVKSLNLDPSMTPVLQNNPDLVQSIIQQHQPDGVYKNYQIAEDDYVKRNSDPSDPQSVARARADFENKVPLVNALTPSGGDPKLNSLNLRKNDWLSKHPGETPPDYFGSPEDMEAHDSQVATLSANQSRAGSSFPALDGSIVTMRNNAQNIANDPDLENVLSLSPGTLAAARKGGYGAELAQSLGVTQHQLDLLHQIDELKGSDTSSLKTANPHLLSSFQPVDADLNGLGNFEAGTDAFKTRLKSLGNDLTTLRAQGIGASGMLSKALDKASDGSLADENVGSKIDPSYLPGGANYLGEPKKLTPTLIDWAKKQIAQGTSRDAVVLHLKLGGYLPKGEF